MKAGRDAVAGLARDIIALVQRLRPFLEKSPESWPEGRGPVAAGISRELAAAVEALDAAVEELYGQAESLESAHGALEIERRAYQEFEGGPNGYVVTDPEGIILRANRRAGEIFRCGVAHLIGELLHDLIRDGAPSLRALLAEFEAREPAAEWTGRAVPIDGPPVPVALTASVVRHADRSLYRVRWSVRDIGLRSRD